MPKHSVRFVLLSMLLGLMLLSAPSAFASTSHLQRFGIGWGYINTDYNLYKPTVIDMGTGWYTDWGYTNISPRAAAELAGAGIQRLTLVLKDRGDYYSDSKCDSLKTYVQQHPDAFQPAMTYWSVGNELGFDITDLTATKYASEFISWRDCIKRINSNYKVGSGAIISLWTVHPRTFPSSCVSDMNDSQSGYSYLKTYINRIKSINSQKLPDFMVMHAYYGCTPPQDGDNSNFSKFKNHILSHRKTMKELGLQNKELWIKEYNSEGYESGSSQFVKDSIEYFMNTKDRNIGNPNDEYRLVQRFAWFMLKNTPGGINSTSQILVSGNGNLSSQGISYKSESRKYAGVPPSPRPTATPTPQPTRQPTNTPVVAPTISPTVTAIYFSPTPRRTTSATPTINPPIPPDATIRPSPSPTHRMNQCAQKILGDANCNGIIDGADYVIWLNSQCHPGGIQKCADLRADFNNDLAVDDADYRIWYNNRI